MVIGIDTLPYQNKMFITTNTTRINDVVTVKSDTNYEGVCQEFVKLNGKIINRTDGNCRRQGFWINSEKNGDYYEGNYQDGKGVGKWYKYDKNGKLLAVIYTPFHDFFNDNFAAILFPFIFLLIIRHIINANIYNAENNTNFPIYGSRFKIRLHEPGELEHIVRTSFTIWFFKYKTENKRLVMISNILSLVLFGTALVLLIGRLTIG